MHAGRLKSLLVRTLAVLWTGAIGGFASGTAVAQSSPPTPWTGPAGNTRTTAQIMALPPFRVPGNPIVLKEEREMEGRKDLPQNPDSPEVSQWPPADPTKPVPGALAAARRPLARIRNGGTVRPSFLGGTTNDFLSIPPDMQGAPGPTQYLMVCNGRIRVFSKTGTTGSLNTDLETFFGSVMTPVTNNFVCDPRVRYDRYNQQWIVIAMDVPEGGSVANRILLAVSDGPTISSSTVWSFFQFQQDQVGTTPNADTGNFADYPTLGLDKNALYIGCNMFGASFTGTTGFVVRRSSLTPGGTPVVTAFRQLCTNFANGPLTPQGVDNDDPNPTEGYFIGTSNYYWGQLILRRISNPGTSPTISPNILITVPSTDYAAEAPHKGNNGAVGKGLLDTVGDRLFAATIHRNRISGAITLTTAHNVGVDSSGVAYPGGRAGIRWYEFDSLTGTPNLVQSGTIYDNSASDPNWYIIPTIAMSGQGRMIIGSTVTGVNTYASVHISERFASTPLGTVESTAIFKSGTAAYNPSYDLGTSRPRRWGDYSMVAVDPTDDMTLWSIQQFTHSTNTYGVEITKHPAPPPATITSVSPPSAGLGTTVNLTVTGTSTANSGFFDTDPAWSFVNRLTASFSGTGVTVNSITFTNPTTLTLNVTVDAAAPLGARTLTITNPDGQSVSLASAFSVDSPTELSVANASGSIGAAVTLSATLTMSGSPLAGKPISFTVGGAAVPGSPATTDASGVASLSYTIPTGGAGNRTIGATFAGDSGTAPGLGNAILTVTKAGTGLAVVAGNAQTGQVVSLSATLTRNTDATPLSGKSVAFTFNGATAGTATTNASGTATLNYTVPLSTLPGSRIVAATFAGDTDHSSTSGNNTWNIMGTTAVTVTAVSTTYLAKPTFRAILKSGTLAVSGKTITFLVDGNVVSPPVTTGPTGLASLVYTATDSIGSHTLQAVFAGDSSYLTSSATTTMTVGKAVTSIAVSNVSVRVGANGILRATLRVGTTPIDEVPVSISLNGSLLGQFTTNSSGIASTTRKAEEPVATLAITASFAGNALYAAAAKSASWVVGKASVKITGDVKSATAGSSTTYGAVLRRITDNAVLVGKTLTFRDSKTSATLGTATTDASGRAQITLTAPAKGVKSFVRIEFAGDSNYLSGVGTGSLTGN